jgi:hypothetical protein
MGRRPDDCWEFYDLKTDPHERKNQIGNPQYQHTITALKQRLDELRAEYGDTADPLRTSRA